MNKIIKEKTVDISIAIFCLQKHMFLKIRKQIKHCFNR